MRKLTVAIVFSILLVFSSVFAQENSTNQTNTNSTQNNTQTQPSNSQGMVYVFIDSSSPEWDKEFKIRASANDADGVNSINVYVDSTLHAACSFTGVTSAECEAKILNSGSYDAEHKYWAEMTDAKGIKSLSNTYIFKYLVKTSDQPTTLPTVPQPDIQIAPNCEKVVNENGFVEIKCNMPQIACPPQISSDELKERCISTGGRFDYISDQNGCSYPKCLFGETAPVFGQQVCVSEDEIDRIVTQCKSNGLSPQMIKQGGCIVPQCGSVEDFSISRTANIEEASKQCSEQGGSFVVKTDDAGNVLFMDCIIKASSNSVSVNPIEEIPDSSDLLQLAFKLESVKIEFEELSDKAAGIADFYTEQGKENDATRMRKVSTMFKSAQEEVDRIKLKIAQKASNDEITKKDLFEIRHDIKYLKDVVMKNILFVMLGAEPTATSVTENCRDEDCFNGIISVCQEGARFTPEEGTVVTLRGIEGDRCIMHIESRGSEMTCKIPDYAFGIRDPKTQMFPHCEGDLKALFEQRAETQEVRSSPTSTEFSIPGICSDAQSCQQYCSRNPDECKKYFSLGEVVSTQLTSGSSEPMLSPGILERVESR